MSAELFGASLLQDVLEESLSSATYDPQPLSVTGLEGLDTIIEACRYAPSDQERTHIIPSDSHHPLEDDLDDDEDNYDDSSSPTRPHTRPVKKQKPVIINITQPPHSSTMATSLLLSHLTALAVLPPVYSGKHGTVVHIDCQNNFNPINAYNAADSLIHRASPTTPKTTITQLAKSALSHVHIIPCSSTISLLQTLHDLPSYLLDQTAHKSSTRPLSLLIISGLNHFTWQDKFTAELTRLDQLNQYHPYPQAQPYHSNQNQDSPSTTSASTSRTTQLLLALKSIHSTFNNTTIYTTTPFTSTPPSNQLADPPNTPNQDIYTLSSLLTIRPSRSNPPQFAPQMSLVECLGDRQRRMDAVRDTRYWFAASAGGLSERRGRDRMGFGMRKGDGGRGWVVES